MSQGKKKYFSVVTPRARTSFTHIREPDTKGKYADNKFKTDLLWDADEDLSAIVKVAHEAAVQEWGEVPDDLEIKIKDGNDRKYEDYHGKVYVTVKTKKRPKQVDAKRNPLPEGVHVGSGDIVKALLSPYCFIAEETVRENGRKKQIKIPTVTFFLNGLQLLEKNAGGFDPSDAFDEEDGYEGDPEDAYFEDDSYKGSTHDADYDPDDY